MSLWGLNISLIYRILRHQVVFPNTNRPSVEIMRALSPPRVSGSFYFTSLVDRAQRLWYSGDRGVTDNCNPKTNEVFGSSTLPGRELPIRQRLTDGRKTTSGNNITYVRNWMDNQSPEKERAGLFRNALRTSVRGGPTEFARLAQTDFDADNGSQAGGESSAATRGPILQCGDYETQDLAIGDLHSQRIVYGEAIRLNIALRRELGPPGESGKNQCTIIHVAADLERLNHRRPKRAPWLAGLRNFLRSLDKAN